MLKSNVLPKSFSATDAPLVMGKPKQAQLSAEIRCLVWNIFKAKRKGWLQGFTQLSQDCDLVLLQEAVSGTTHDRHFTTDQRMQWIMARSHKAPRSGIVTGVKTGSIADVTYSRSHASAPREPVVQTQKMLLETGYRLPNGAQLCVLNMHAINFVSNRKYNSHMDQLAGALERQLGPVILAGDFNTWSSHRRRSFEAVAKSHGLMEANMPRSYRLRHLNKHLDHLYYRGLTLLTAQSLDDNTLSDHAPIIATFEQESL